LNARAAVVETPPLRPRVVFVAKFIAWMIAFYVAIALNAVNDRVIVPFSAWLASAAAFLLRTAEGGVAATGTVMRSPRFALDVHNGCNGVEAAILLAAAMLAFPATWRSRLLGLTAGTAVIQLLNLVRLCTLFWLGEHHRQTFDFFHVGVWQALVILGAISFFMVWSLKFAARPAREDR
jgi:exosortase H (IPTLxxWG-CTERM-specific)